MYKELLEKIAWVLFLQQKHEWNSEIIREFVALFF